MHKGVILLTKAENRDEALDNVSEFMEQYGGGDVWDWYSVGNRWNNTLAPTDKIKTFTELVLKQYPKLNGMYPIDYVENNIDRPIIQKIWTDLGLTGKNPYWDYYGFSIKDTEEDYNVVPLENCIDTVKEWCKDLKKEAEAMFAKMVEAKTKAEEGEYDMSGYYAGIYKHLNYGDFSFESNVYNITEGVAEEIPEDISEYFAVMIDMHN